MVQAHRLDQLLESATRRHERTFDHTGGGLVEIPDIQQLDGGTELLCKLARRDVEDLSTSALAQFGVGG